MPLQCTLTLTQQSQQKAWSCMQSAVDFSLSKVEAEIFDREETMICQKMSQLRE